MTAPKRSFLTRRHAKTALLLVVVILAVGTLGACSPYASVDVGIPLKVGPVYVNPSIGVGGFL